MEGWEFIDTVYTEAEVGHIKANLEKSGYAVKVEYHKTPSEIPSWWILVKKKSKSQ